MNTTPTNLLPIGAFAAAVGLSLKALRLYDQQAILPPAFVDPDSGYRYYKTEQMRNARLIRLMRDMEMPLADIRQTLNAPQEEAERQVIAFCEAVQARVHIVRSTSRTLLHILRNEEISMAFDVNVTEAAPMLIASITKKTRVDGIQEVICNSVGALFQFIEAQGGKPADVPFGLFHGPINQNDDGPIEVCIPIQGKFAPSGDIVVRELAGGKLATVETVGEECEFPALLGAYDAAAAWIQQNGYDVADSPREIWTHMGPDIPICEQRMRIEFPFREKTL